MAKPKHIPEERPVGRIVPALDHHMAADNHEFLLLPLILGQYWLLVAGS
jgi:hypothetical protein